MLKCPNLEEKGTLGGGNREGEDECHCPDCWRNRVQEGKANADGTSKQPEKEGDIGGGGSNQEIGAKDAEDS